MISGEKNYLFVCTGGAWVHIDMTQIIKTLESLKMLMCKWTHINIHPVHPAAKEKAFFYARNHALGVAQYATNGSLTGII